MPSDSMDRPEVKRELRKIDGMIPESVDRRSFFKSSLATMMGGLFAGCSSGGSGTTASPTQGTSGGDKIVKNVVFRPAWKPEPHHSIPFIASIRGHWEERGISSPKVMPGYGSGDMAKRVGTGKEEMGYGNVVPQIKGYPQGYDLKQIGAHIAKNSLALYWRPDMVDSPGDLSGKTVLRNDALGEQTWPLMAQAIDVDNVNLKFVKDEIQPSVFADGDAPAAWAYLTGYGRFVSAFENKDAEFKIVPLYRHLPTYGYIIAVNGSWLEKGRNLEYTTRMLSGYSEAGKWLLLHPEQGIKVLRDQVNPALQGIDMSQLLTTFKAGFVSLNLTEGIKNNGYGYLNEEALKNTYSELGGALSVEEVPTVDDYADFRPQENADMPSFTNDEWKQLKEFAGEYAEISQ